MDERHGVAWHGASPGDGAAPSLSDRTFVQLTFLRAREVSFGADRPFRAYADGDPIAKLPVTIRVVPRALQVLAP